MRRLYQLGISAGSIIAAADEATPEEELLLPKIVNASVVHGLRLEVFDPLFVPKIASTAVARALKLDAAVQLFAPKIVNAQTMRSLLLTAAAPTALLVPKIVNAQTMRALALTLDSNLVTFTAHRYWRLNMLEDLGNSYQLAEVELRDAYGGADLTGSGTVSASNATNGAAANAVDNNNATIWRTANVTLPAWWQYDFGAGNDKAICEVVLVSGPNNPTTRSPARFEVQYSDDGSAWTTAWQARKRVWGANETKVFVRPTVSYRINVTANDGAAGGAAHQIAELEFLVGGVDQSVGGNANVQGTGGVEADLAFDDSTATAWSNTSMAQPYWMRYDFKDNPPFDLEQVSIVVGSANLTRAPNTFTIERSDDGGNNWSVLQSVSGETGWGVNEKRTFTI